MSPIAEIVAGMRVGTRAMTCCPAHRRRSAHAPSRPIRPRSPARASAAPKRRAPADRPASRRGRSMLPDRAEALRRGLPQLRLVLRQPLEPRNLLGPRRNEIFARAPAPRERQDAVREHARRSPSTADAMAIVRRSRGSSTGLCTECEREALVRLATFAIARRRGEEIARRRIAGRHRAPARIAAAFVDVPSMRHSSPIARAFSTVTSRGSRSPSAASTRSGSVRETTTLRETASSCSSAREPRLQRSAPAPRASRSADCSRRQSREHVVARSVERPEREA